ncbi:hypothetical protein V8E54_012560 [Elaphomyces granulatus]
MWILLRRQGCPQNVVGMTYPSLRWPKLEDDLFWEILKELSSNTYQYGTRDYQVNEEARSRVILAHFNRIVSLFAGLLFNTPEVLLESESTKSGRIEYQYTGILPFCLYIEVKFQMGTRQERLEQETRSVCEALYYFCFLKAYANGLRAYWELSVKRSEADKTRDSTPMWNAVTLAKTALGQAKFAREEYDNGRLNESKAEAKEASEYLRESVEQAPL